MHNWKRKLKHFRPEFLFSTNSKLKMIPTAKNAASDKLFSIQMKEEKKII